MKDKNEKESAVDAKKTFGIILIVLLVLLVIAFAYMK